MNKVVIEGEVKFAPQTNSGEWGSKTDILIVHQHEKSEKKSDIRIQGWGGQSDILSQLHVGDKIKATGELVHNRYKKDDEWIDRGLAVNLHYVDKLEAAAPQSELAPDTAGLAEPKVADEDLPF